MSAHLTEEEQIEAFKRWWKEHGVKAITVIVIATAGYFGYTGYMSMQEKHAQAHSALYDDLIKTVAADADAKPSDTELASITKAAEAVIAQDQNALYADLARFQLAKIAVESNDLKAAEAHLQAVIDHSKTASSVDLASLRLARVKAAQGLNDEALALLSKGSSDAFSASYAETRGDILQGLGRLDDAFTAYEAAITSLDKQQNNTGSMRSNILKFKLDNARVAKADPLAAVATPKADAQTEAGK
ncbi:MAG: tetratricopeptide repeat protein [Marinagarivorans sp.]|nr:tetratricopeptide repeat protein [Marinagarivorans sp.]